VGNALLALSAAQEYFALCGKEPPSLRALAAHMGRVEIPGRFALLPTPLAEVDFVIDYAHNGYSLAAAIAALRAYEPRRLVCLFGSVGGRTYSRRAELARAACGADFCIVTSDNPGDEPPEETMREICAVLEERGREYIAIPDRAEAVRYAVRHARAGDMILLAGKGHEDFQLIGTRRLPFSEREILLRTAEERESVPL
jgi:UDP-N-acetylmuramoyl-L-alanyl-D-glutamate--2,6-diaminopimelate ligase